jgi:dihydroneopterin aldolase
MDKVIIKGLHIFAYHGVNPEEKVDGQNFIVDTIIYADIERACFTDNLDDTVNYAKVVKVITAAMTDQKYDLIEKAAAKVAEHLLDLSKKINAVEVTVKKPQAPINAEFEYVAVEITRTRS